MDYKNVAVILGDLDKIDAVRPEFTYGEIDSEVIDLLKKSLAELKDYNFIFLSNHDTLINDLQNLRNQIDFVLNFCDQGFNNDSNKELHIPALLELLDIYYSGSGPQCLANCYDKALIRGIATQMGVPVAKAVILEAKNKVDNIDLSLIHI